MAQFELTNNQVSVVDDTTHRVQLTPQQALDLLQWLFEHQDDLEVLAQPPTQPLRHTTEGA